MSLKRILVDALPQLQCRKCTYKDCESYADAIINQNEALDKCEPGSNDTYNQLSEIMNGSSKKIKLNEIKNFPIATIETKECIGCTICIKVCPVDAIIGAKHKLHFVIHDQCNGCELCISECPVECMKMMVNPDKKSWIWPSKQSSESDILYQNKKLGIAAIKKEKLITKVKLNSHEKIKSYIKTALSREEERRKNLTEYE